MTAARRYRSTGAQNWGPGSAPENSGRRAPVSVSTQIGRSAPAFIAEVLRRTSRATRSASPAQLASQAVPCSAVRSTQPGQGEAARGLASHTATALPSLSTVRLLSASAKMAATVERPVPPAADRTGTTSGAFPSSEMGPAPDGRLPSFTCCSLLPVTT